MDFRKTIAVEEEHELIEKVLPHLAAQMQKGLKLILFKKD